MLEQGLSLIVGIIAPFLFSLLNKIGLKGVPMLWVVYVISVIVAIGINAITGTLDFSNVSVSVGVIVATAQTVFHLFKDKAPQE